MKTALRYFICGLFIAITAVSCKKAKEDIVIPIIPPPQAQVIAPPLAFGFYVVGYFPSYRNVALVPDVKFKMCNVIN